jgi:hypothetical protein
VPFLQKLTREWKRSLSTGEQDSALFDLGGVDREWLTRIHERAANVVQLAEPHRAVGESANALARELFDELVGAGPKPKSHAAANKRGVQLVLEGALRRGGFENDWERNFEAPGAEIQDWTFDYAVKNGTPLHLIQTLSFKTENVKALLAEATYVAYAKQDLAGSDQFGGVPVSVVADPPEESRPVVDEARTILMSHAVDLVMRDDVPELVERLQVVAGRSMSGPTR